MLGFSKAIRLFTSAAFGGGEGIIWLTKLVCNGTENSLLDCKNAIKYLGNTGCTHEKDAGVECLNYGKLPNIVILIQHLLFSNKFWLTISRLFGERNLRGALLFARGWGTNTFLSSGGVIGEMGGPPLCLIRAFC